LGLIIAAQDKNFWTQIGGQWTFSHQLGKSNTTIIMKITRLLLLLALLSYSILAKAQDQRKFDYFDAVSATGDVTVTLIKADAPSASIVSEGIDEDNITMYIKDGMLRIQLIEGWFDDSDEVDITVYYEQLRTVKAAAGARVLAEGTIESEELKLKAASGAILEASVSCESLSVSVSEGAELTVSGTTERQDVHVNTGAQYYGFALESPRSKVKSNTGGEAYVVARERLDANANTGGSIYYKGDPEYKSTRSLISGGISRVDDDER
jgi:hypothetical protein